MLAASRLSGLLPLAGVAGYPVAHSLSPAMMAAWLETSGLPGRYTAFEIAPEQFETAIRALPALGITGLNITLPHKRAAFEIADTLGDAARAVGAVNLLVRRDDGGLHGDNTDVIGIAAALRQGGVDRAEGPAVILGAGGAARAALYQLRREGYDDIRIVNRTPDRARQLAEDFEIDFLVRDWDSANEALDGAALIVNASSLGMAGQPNLTLDLSPSSRNALVFDMVYVPLETQLLRQARQTGRRTVDGLAMLIGQARPSFEAFFGAPPPDTAAVRDLLVSILETRS
ncbi:shikimate dehydrogenase [Marinicauda pacifica]|uniref:shikimate dehydrogenase n=1 Tax=Marinicauda pacifica TaxID=1133559 RepID=UPI0035C869FC